MLGGVELMSQPQISADETSSSTKQMVGIEENLKLDRSATNAQAAFTLQPPQLYSTTTPTPPFALGAHQAYRVSGFFSASSTTTPTWFHLRQVGNLSVGMHGAKKKKRKRNFGGLLASLRPERNV